MTDRVAVLLDGGFVKKKLGERLGRFPAVADVVALTTSVTAQPRLQGSRLFRIYYYDAPPFSRARHGPEGGGHPDRARHRMDLAQGLRVYLETMGHGVRRELKAHSDFVL